MILTLISFSKNTPLLKNLYINPLRLNHLRNLNSVLLK